MTYFVDPQSGNDSNSGVRRDDAWQSFAPLSGLILEPGDHVEILAPGKCEHTLVLKGGGTAENPVTVHFARGRYDFHPAQAQKRRYDISNCNDDADAVKAIAILLENACHIKVIGDGACIVCRGKMIELCIDNSEAIFVSGLAFDYQRPTVSEFAVTAVGPEYADLAVHKDSNYTVKNERICWLGEGWQHETGVAQELIPETDEVWRRKDPLNGMKIEELAPFRVRAHGNHDMVAGRIFQLRESFRDCAGVFMRFSRDVVMRDVDFYFMHGMGVLCQFTQNIALERVRIAPADGSGRTSAAWADCMHFSGCRGKIQIKDCLFCGAHDDAVNVHGTHLRIIQKVSENQIMVRFMHRQTYGFMAFYPGDEIEFVHWDTLAPFAVNRVQEAVLVNSREILLTLDKPVPNDWNKDDVIENVTWTAEVEIRGCTVKRIPTRGFLLTTRRRVLIEENAFEHLRMAGVLVESDAEGWFESGCVRDMVIRRNRFIECKRAAVCINPHNSCPNPSVHRNIRITDNEIVVPKGSMAVKARGTAGLVVTGNRVTPPVSDHTAMFDFAGCMDVVCDLDHQSNESVNKMDI